MSMIAPEYRRAMPRPRGGDGGSSSTITGRFGGDRYQGGTPKAEPNIRREAISDETRNAIATKAKDQFGSTLKTRERNVANRLAGLGLGAGAQAGYLRDLDIERAKTFAGADTEAMIQQAIANAGHDVTRFNSMLGEAGSRRGDYLANQGDKQLHQRAYEYDTGLGQRESEFGRNLGQRESEFGRGLHQQDVQNRRGVGLGYDQLAATTGLGYANLNERSQQFERNLERLYDLMGQQGGQFDTSIGANLFSDMARLGLGYNQLGENARQYDMGNDLGWGQLGLGWGNNDLGWQQLAQRAAEFAYGYPFDDRRSIVDLVGAGSGFGPVGGGILPHFPVQSYPGQPVNYQPPDIQWPAIPGR